MQLVCEICTCPYEHTRQRRTTSKVCRNCMVNRHRWTLKHYMVAYKGGGCQVCGYSELMRALDFHHVEPQEKEFSFGGKHCMGWDRLKVELDKCVCVCQNCHAAIHEAIDMQVWGHPDPGILAKIKAAHAAWVKPDMPKFRHSWWREHHPKFRKRAA